MRFSMVVPAGFEPATSRFGGEHSIQLSYGTTYLLHVTETDRKNDTQSPTFQGAVCGRAAPSEGSALSS
jgi:hypothetical protein